MLERLMALQDTLQDMMRGDDARGFASIPWSADVCYMARWVRRQIRWDPWWQRVATIVHNMEPVMQLLRRMDRGGQFMSLMLEWVQDLMQRVKEAYAPLGSSIADRIMRHEYHAWLVRQAKRYILTQTGFELEGAEYLLARRQFEDFHMQQGRFDDWGGAKGRARGRGCSDDAETIECASWWSLYGADAPDLQLRALRVMHMWSCASPAERNRAVHEGIHMKKRNRFAFEKVVQLVEITANVRLKEYRWAGCGYVLPWQCDEGMLNCRAGLEVELVRTGTRQGMTATEIVEGGASNADTSRAEVGTLTPAPAGREPTVQLPPAPSPAPPTPVSPLHPATTLAETEELASSLPPHGLLQRSTVVRQLRLRSPFPGVLQEEGDVATAAQEAPTVSTAREEVPAQATAEKELAAVAPQEAIPMNHDGAGIDEKLETTPHMGDMPPPPPRPPVGDPSSSLTGTGSRSPQTPGRSRIRNTIVVHRDVCDMTLFERTNINLDSTSRVTEHTAHLLSGLGPPGVRTTAAREVPASGCEPQQGCHRGVSTETLEHALRAATCAVYEYTPSKHGVPPRPCPVAAEGGAALGESLGAERLGMPPGSRGEQPVAGASARVVVLRKGGGLVTVEEDDLETNAAVRAEDKDYKGEEEGEEESESGSGGDDDYDDDGPTPPPPTRASRGSVEQTSLSARGRRRSTSDTRGGMRKQSGKGKKGR
ncbi:hypothetical protein CBR_g40694 [Chara braunii]|uniref:HAT C-terminal dimerisation domain-containing protein n=1 Tax=Chara braunii TaxID=69332 RepID=A0A388LUJ2_CHABU|nr:hypothetical protein CBR_g40694 [Chara braunii]|eukprot:GBG85882.1 hypothetical protein CBR_g40694 [Chara braunii]